MESAVRARQEIKDFHEAWWFLYDHPAFDGGQLKGGDSRFETVLDVTVVKVDPMTKSIMDEKSRNTETRVWLECGPWLKPDGPEAKHMNEQNPNSFPESGMASHDYDLDCGGATYEEAILKLANLVLKKYGDYPDPEA